MNLNNKGAITDKVACVIMAGGQGTRLFPLTATRCKPAVGFGGQYRLIDIPISNALNAQIRHLFVVSQYFSTGLNNHIKETYHLDHFHAHDIHLLNPEETLTGHVFYEGTADAVKKNLSYILSYPIDYVMILSGDQLYNMDLYAMLQFAIGKDADLTIATLPVTEELAPRMGIMKIDDQSWIEEFQEKPTDPSPLALSPDFQKRRKISHPYLASMGIYIFKKEALITALDEVKGSDFGKHVIPYQLKKGPVAAFLYDGYWEDIGTVASYYEASLALTNRSLGLNLYNESCPIYSHAPSLPCPHISNTSISHSIVCSGALIGAKSINHSIIGTRAKIGEGTSIDHSVIMGQESYFNSLTDLEYGIGKNCSITKAIIDENTQIGDNVKLVNHENRQTYDGDGVYIRDGIIIVTSGTKLPSGFTL
ncbi:MAG: glucose-1-phosphate adenylyltransferase [Simkaniaceae bacterium]|nr:glucose-1-phosphate adenylyltransferase [Simkaniaceae bacterium]